MLLIGETLNSSSPSVHAALRTRDAAWVRDCARRQLDAGVDALDCGAAAMGPSERTSLLWLAELLEQNFEVPLCLDSSDVAVLAHTGHARRHPPLLHAVRADPPWPDRLVALVALGASLVVQLRERSRLPADAATRVRWAERALQGAARVGIPERRILLDPILLPWGEDLVAGASLLAFVEEAARRWPAVRTLVSLSNAVATGDPRHQVELSWLRALRDAGIGAVILNPFDAPLLAQARGDVR